jgi:transcriptional regulator of nitric oxide reductase
VADEAGFALAGIGEAAGEVEVANKSGVCTAWVKRWSMKNQAIPMTTMAAMTVIQIFLVDMWLSKNLKINN